MSQGSWRDEEYWRSEWERNEDEKAIVDVDVRGWIYSPQTGPMTRRNRMLIGLARRLSGVVAPRGETQEYDNEQEMREDIREQDRIEREAAQIERQGQEQKRIANQGGYSERPKIRRDADGGSMDQYQARRTSLSTPTSPTQTASLYSTSANEMTEAELVIANANLMARIAPFLTMPMVALPITIFFYNESQSQSRTVITNDAGHFIIRAALEFVPTHVRVLANEKLSTIQEIRITEPYGISLISDVDDTIKTSNISGGAREIFRNTFVRNLNDLTVDGVREWYSALHKLGVSVHYCSNSPWQLYPVLASYLKLAGLPPGSLHLKQYSGMMQGIFEPVAERKKPTLERIFRDFPQRKFILVGDSGEVDIEVYTELAMANPGRVLAVFIRDVTTPEVTEFFDPSIDEFQRQNSNFNSDNGKGSPRFGGSLRQNSAPTVAQVKKTPSGPSMGTLIDFTEEPQPASLNDLAGLNNVQNKASTGTQSAIDLLSARKPPPPRPVKPAALRSSPSNSGKEAAVGLGVSQTATGSSENSTRPTPPPRKPGLGPPGLQPPTQMPGGFPGNPSQPLSRQKPIKRSPTVGQERFEAPPPPLPRRRGGTPSSMSPKLRFLASSAENSDIDYEPLPPSAAPKPPPSIRSARSGRGSAPASPTGSPRLGAQGVNRKLEMWRRQLARAQEQLEYMGIPLYTWRRGQDVEEEAIAIVQQAMKEMEQGRKKNA
jgi:phosphatidate phosphatase APP1